MYININNILFMKNNFLKKLVGSGIVLFLQIALMSGLI